MDILIMAFWTDNTRIATLMVGDAQSSQDYSFLPGVKGNWHGISHHRDIPTQLTNDDNSRLRSTLDVIDVKRDGRAEPYTVSNIDPPDGSTADMRSPSLRRRSSRGSLSLISQ
mgnify:CR=1 FL=1